MDQDKLNQDQVELNKIREEDEIISKWEWDEEKKKEKRRTLYSYFLENEFSAIQEAFLKSGKPIVSTDDVSTWVGWKEQGRRIKRGSKGISVMSNEKYPTTIFNNGAPVIDEKRKQPMVRYAKKWYRFFHIDQTQLIN